MILGILGGIGSGKSTVTDMFAALGAQTLDADAIAHQLIETEEAKSTLRQWWGEEIITPEGKVDRTKIARKVFSDAAELVRLNNLIHPGVRKEIEEAIAKFMAENNDEKKLLVLDVPLLASSTLKDFCDEIIFVNSDESLRESRTRLRGWSREDLKQREACQVPENDKKKLAGFIINNSGSLDETRQQVEALYQDLVSMDFS